jgi:hypothetical protein
MYSRIVATHASPRAIVQKDALILIVALPFVKHAALLEQDTHRLAPRANLPAQLAWVVPCVELQARPAPWRLRPRSWGCGFAGASGLYDG